MKNKKSIAMAMTAVSTLGAVAPAFANEIQTRAFNAENIDVMLASGYKLDKVKDGNGNETETVKVYKRTDIYNTNGTKDRKDDTLKPSFKEKKIVLSKEDKTNSYLDEFVLATKVELGEMNEAKSHITTAEAKIAEAKNDETLVVKVNKKAAEIKNGSFENSVVTVTITDAKTNAEKGKYIFIGAEGIVSDDEPEAAVTGSDLFDKIFKNLKLETLKQDETYPAVSNSLTLDLAKENKELSGDEAKDDKEKVRKNYADINLIKYTIEKNIEKFDIVKEEVDERDKKNNNLKVTLFVKGSDHEEETSAGSKILKNKVIEITFKNFAKENIDETLIINMPNIENSDFKTHWAKDSIEKAMYAGHVDAVEKFNPEISVTRAQFAKMACEIFGIKYTEDMIEPFNDVTKADGWKYEYITALYNKKVKNAANKEESVMKGDGEKFRPDDKITRQEVAVVLAKLTKDKLENDKKSPVTFKNDIKLDETHKVVIGYDKDGKEIIKEQEIDVLTKFSDDEDIDNWADNSVKFLNEYVEYFDTTTKKNKAVAEGVLQNDGTRKFNAKSDITRAEALVMVQRAAIATAVTGTTK